LAKVSVVAVTEVPVNCVTRATFAKKFVEVVLVPVAFDHWRLETLNGFWTVRFAKVAFVANKTEDVAKSEVKFEKTAVDLTFVPIGVPSIEPPEMIALGVVRLAMKLVRAFIVVPEAVEKPSQEEVVF